MTDQRVQTFVDEHPVMRWGPVFAGWFVAIGMALVLYEFGLALGLSAFDPHDATNATTVMRGVTVGAAVWTILTWGASLWIGAMVASWFDGGDDTEMGVVRGLTVWGLAMASTALLAATGLTHAALANMLPQTGGPAANPSQAAHYVAALMWVAFGSSLVSLITSVIGGWLGAHQVHHVYHLRKYPRRQAAAAGRLGPHST
jgi:hypothetical protein